MKNLKTFEELINWEKELLNKSEIKKFKIGDIVKLLNNRFFEDEFFKIDEIDNNYDDHGQKSEDRLDGKYHMIIIDDDNFHKTNIWANSVDIELAPDIISKTRKYNL